MKVLVMGSTGGSGLAAVERLLAEGHQVTAFARDPSKIAVRSDRLARIAGDAMRPQDVERAVPGHDAVVVALGITENPLRVRLFGPARTPINVRSAGTRNAIAAMHKHRVRKLVVQTSYGVGETRGRLDFITRLFFALLLKPQIADTEVQEQLVKESGLDWLIVQPVHLTDDADDAMPFTSASGETAAMKVSRKSVGRFLAHAATTAISSQTCIALSRPIAEMQNADSSITQRAVGDRA